MCPFIDYHSHHKNLEDWEDCGRPDDLMFFQVLLIPIARLDSILLFTVAHPCTFPGHMLSAQHRGQRKAFWGKHKVSCWRHHDETSWDPSQSVQRTSGKGLLYSMNGDCHVFCLDEFCLVPWNYYQVHHKLTLWCLHTSTLIMTTQGCRGIAQFLTITFSEICDTSVSFRHTGMFTQERECAKITSGVNPPDLDL